jgi:cytoskeletal protein CcmA (bactofilin family)
MAWKKPEEETQPAPARQPASTTPRPTADVGRSPTATIGSSISITGDIQGDEDLTVDGKVDGKIDLRKHRVTVGREGRVKADIYARSIRIEGQVHGNLIGESEVVIQKTGQVRGNITAPSVQLENGSKFKGSIDMEPGGETSAGADKDDTKSEKSSLHAATGAASSSASASPKSSAAGSAASSRN